MDFGARWGVLAAVAVLLCCQEPSEAPSSSAPPALEVPSREPAAPVLSSHSCDQREDGGGCTEYPAARDIFGWERGCQELNGRWSEHRCARDGALGACTFESDGVTQTLLGYQGRHRAAEELLTLCGALEGRYVSFVSMPESVAEEVAIGEASGSGVGVPRYRFAPPRGWALEAPRPAPSGFVHVAYYRQRTPMPDGTRPNVLIRRTLSPTGATIDSIAEEARAGLLAEGDMTIADERRAGWAGAPALILEARVAGGTPYHVLMLIVLDGPHVWTLHCAGSPTTRRRWEPLCSAALRSFRVEG